MNVQSADNGAGGPEKPASFPSSAGTESTETVLLSIITSVETIDSRFLESARSVLSQSLWGTEWLVFDAHGNAPGLAAAVSELVTSAGTRVRLLPGTAAGVEARQAGLRLASGEYVCFLDAGIVLAPTYLEKCVWLLDAQPGFVFCNSELRVAERETSPRDHGPESAAGHAVRRVSAGSGTVFRRSALEKVLLSGERLEPGLEFEHALLSLAENDQWGFSIPEVLRTGAAKESTESGSDGNGEERLSGLLRQRYPALLSRFPKTHWIERAPYAPLRTTFAAPCTARPSKGGRAVLLVVPWMVVGGADKFNLDLVELLVGHGHSVTVCATLEARHEWQEHFRAHTPDVFVMRNFLDVSDIPRFLSYLIVSRAIDVVVISGSTLAYQLLPYLRSHSPRVAFMDLNHIEEPDWQSGGHPRFGVGYRDLLDMNVVSTRHLADWMVSRGAERDRLRILHTGVDEPAEETVRSHRRTIRAELGLSEDLPVIIFGGRLTAQKRPDVLAEILARLASEGFDFHALIVGDGEERPRFESLVTPLRSGRRASSFGAVSHDRWLGLLHAADILLMPSAHEGISIALLEALAAGVVPVVSDVGGQKEVVGEAVGFLVPLSATEVDQYVGALAQLIGSSELRARMGRAARLLVSHEFSREATIKQFERIMSDALASLGKSTRPDMMTKALAIELASSAVEMERLNRTLLWLNDRVSTAPGGLATRWIRLVAGSRLGAVLVRNSLVRRIRARVRQRG